MRAASLGVAALVLLAGSAFATTTPIKVCLYNNLGVVASETRAALIFETLRWLIPSHPVYVSSLPSADELATCEALVIPGNQGSFWQQEGLDSSGAMRTLIANYVSSGKILVLLNGYSTSGGNQFTPLIDMLLGRPSGCSAVPVTGDFLAYRRSGVPGIDDRLPSPIKVKPDTGVSAMSCASLSPPSLSPIYTGVEPSLRRTVSVAHAWPIGAGGLLWVGSGYVMPNLKGYSELVANVIAAHTGIATSSPPPPSPPPRVSPSPPPPKVSPSPPPPRPATSSPPPPPPSPPPPPPPSPPPPVSSPPPPPVSSPPPPPVSSPPPPPVSSPPPPPVSSPPPPPPVSSSPPPPVSSSPPPKVSSPPPPSPPPPSPPPPVSSPPPPPPPSPPPPSPPPPPPPSPPPPSPPPRSTSSPPPPPSPRPPVPPPPSSPPPPPPHAPPFPPPPPPCTGRACKKSPPPPAEAPPPFYYYYPPPYEGAPPPYEY